MVSTYEKLVFEMDRGLTVYFVKKKTSKDSSARVERGFDESFVSKKVSCFKPALVSIPHFFSTPPNFRQKSKVETDFETHCHFQYLWGIGVGWTRF